MNNDLGAEIEQRIKRQQEETLNLHKKALNDRFQKKKAELEKNYTEKAKLLEKQYSGSKRLMQALRVVAIISVLAIIVAIGAISQNRAIKKAEMLQDQIQEVNTADWYLCEKDMMVKRLRDEAQLKQIAVNQLNRLKEKYDKLKTSTDENSQKLTEATLEHDEKDTADKVEILSLREQLEAKDKEIDRLKKALNNNQTELDASVIAQKALKSDLEATQRELQVIKQETVKSQKNPFGAGRKREHTEQLEKIMELHAQGLSHRAISEIVKVPSATVGRYIKQMNQNNIDL